MASDQPQPPDDYGISPRTSLPAQQQQQQQTQRPAIITTTTSALDDPSHSHDNFAQTLSRPRSRPRTRPRLDSLAGGAATPTKTQSQTSSANASQAQAQQVQSPRESGSRLNVPMLDRGLASAGSGTGRGTGHGNGHGNGHTNGGAGGGAGGRGWRLEAPRARSVPAWVRLEDDEADLDNTSPNSDPSKSRKRRKARARAHPPQFPYLDDPSTLDVDADEPVLRESRWRRFASPSAYPRNHDLAEELVDKAWLDANIGSYSVPWIGAVPPKQRQHQHQHPRPDDGDGVITSPGPGAGDSEGGRRRGDPTSDPEKQSPVPGQLPPRRRQRLCARWEHRLLFSPYVPLIIRMVVFGFSVIALALGASIRHYLEKSRHRPNNSSALMAIVVDAVALVYLVYVTYDEFRGKPIGLRSPLAKMRLILLDLVFIIFDSANLSLAFEALSDVTESCAPARIDGQYNPASTPVCQRQKALASVLLVALIAWVITFSISVFRLVARVSAGGHTQ